MEFQKQVALKSWTGWKVGGPAEFFCLPQNVEDLKSAWDFARQKNLPITVLSGGTNILVSDLGIQGLVIGLKKLHSLEVKEKENKIYLSALSGTPKYELFKIFTQYKLEPALFLCGLPGDVGGGVVMNAGVGGDTTPKEFCEIVDGVKVFSFLDGNLKFFKKEQLEWSYRSCKGWEEGMIYQVGFSWPIKPMDDFHLKLKKVNRKRTSSQPLSQFSCGSVFKNPPGEKSGRLIEQSGLKGCGIGQAEVSNKHANFIINKGEASAKDIHRLICRVREKVKQDSNIILETEIHYLGMWNHEK